jgi:hypothetical protein
MQRLYHIIGRHVFDSFPMMDNHLVTGQGQKNDLPGPIMANQLRDDLRVTQLGIILIDDDAPNILLVQKGSGVGHVLNL